jgi:hypothetical protein
LIGLDDYAVNAEIRLNTEKGKSYNEVDFGR